MTGADPASVRETILPLFGDQFKDAAFMGSDMVGLVAFDLILGIGLRCAMAMTFIVEIPGMDGDDGSRHDTGFGIPAHMIANSEPPDHFIAFFANCRMHTVERPIFLPVRLACILTQTHHKFF